MLAVLQEQVNALRQENESLRARTGQQSAPPRRPQRRHSSKGIRRRSSFRQGQLNIRKADAHDADNASLSQIVLDLINDAYRRGEKGLLQEPWNRACAGTAATRPLDCAFLFILATATPSEGAKPCVS